MTIASREALRSITSEAGRQADYYDRRGNAPLCQMWSEIESLAHAAARHGTMLKLTPVNNRDVQDVNPLPIKPCE
jgi:hypothetical protein